MQPLLPNRFPIKQTIKMVMAKNDKEYLESNCIY